MTVSAWSYETAIELRDWTKETTAVAHDWSISTMAQTYEFLLMSGCAIALHYIFLALFEWSDNEWLGQP